jgi:hypothetical protein
LLFVYRRLDTLRQTVASLQANTLAPDSELFIFSDQGRTAEDQARVIEIRAYLKRISGFRKINIFESDSNKGLANSVIDGVSRIINECGRAIVLEDDLLLSPNFLAYMNSALDKYEHNPQVYSISGFMFDTNTNGSLSHHSYPYDVFFTRRHCSWGWAMWKDRWNAIDWEVKDYPAFILDSAKLAAFNRIGSDLGAMLHKQMTGRIDSWAIRCIYHQFRNGGYTAYPVVSKVENIGFGEGATHTRLRFNRYKASLEDDAKYVFTLPDKVSEEKWLLRKFTSRFSVPARLYYYGLNKILPAWIRI